MRRLADHGPQGKRGRDRDNRSRALAYSPWQSGIEGQQVTSPSRFAPSNVDHDPKGKSLPHSDHRSQGVNAMEAMALLSICSERVVIRIRPTLGALSP